MLCCLMNGFVTLSSFLVCVSTWLAVNLGIPAAFLVFLVAGYSSLTLGRCTSKRRMDGKTVIITGANSGIGLHTAKELAMRGARVILACRNQQRADAARAEILRDTEAPPENVVVEIVDLADLKSVRFFAERIISRETRLDVLINNAGLAYAGPRKTTGEPDRLEYVMASNHYGHFLLTNLLLDLLKKSTPSRIINVSSIAHLCGDVSLDSLKDPKREGWVLYADAKLANIVFTKELAKRLPSGVSAYSLHPGAVATNFLDNASKGIREIIILPFKYIASRRLKIWKTGEEGAQTSVHLAVSQDVGAESGAYFADCKPSRIWNRQAFDPEIGKKFWDYSALVTGLTSDKKDD